MKKLLVLILALVMVMSLTACGGETIEITTDNWQDYLLVKQEIIDNGGGESSVEMKEDFEITRIEGTLVLE